MSAPLPALVTEAEFLALPPSLERVELVDGEVVVAPAPTFRHQAIVRRLVMALGAWSDAQGGGITVAQAPLDVRFGPDRILQPDIMVWGERLDLDVPSPIARVPMLCVEVLSIDRAYDRVTKRFLYAAAGVAEYWTVDPAGAIERWHGEGLSQRDVITERIESSRLPGFAVDVSSLFVA